MERAEEVLIHSVVIPFVVVFALMIVSVSFERSRFSPISSALFIVSSVLSFPFESSQKKAKKREVVSSCNLVYMK